MRRDVCFYFSANVKSVYKAYLMAATNEKFRRSCSEEAYHTISFGLNFSMKYNMNGGACTLHFIPHREGTAVDLRFSIVQLAGARYEKYATDLTNDAAKVLGVGGVRIELDIEEFTNEMNKVRAEDETDVITSEKTFSVEKPTSVSAENTHIKPASALKSTFFHSEAENTVSTNITERKADSIFCLNCGKELGSDMVFCIYCGTEVIAQKKFCTNCGRQAEDMALFCAGCGNKLT